MRLHDLFKSINDYIFYYGECITAAILLYFFNVTSTAFFITYLIFLAVIFLIKHLWLKKKFEVSTENFSLLPVSIFFMEFFIIFMEYTGIYENTPVYEQTDIIVAVAGIIAFLFSTAFINSKLFNSFFFFCIVIGIFVSALLSKSFLHGLKGVFIEVCKVIFACFIIHTARKYEEKQVSGITIAVIALFLIYILVLNELGTFMVIMASYLIYLISEMKRKTIGISALCIALIGIPWYIIYTHDNIYSLIYGTIENIDSDSNNILSEIIGDKKITILTALKRLFFDYSDDDQLVMLNDISFGRNLLFEILKLAAPSEYVKIVSFATTNTTDEADYLFSVLMYSVGKIYTLILTFTGLFYYINSINKNINSPIRIIPVILISQTIIHIMGNIMIFPFTGIPYPFLSHGASSLLCNILMVFILTKYESEAV